MDKYLDTAIKSALRAGEEIIKVYDKEDSDFEIEFKSDNSPLTLADKKSNAVICRDLSCFNIPILSEEIKNSPYSERRDWQRLWIIDPLDGTKEFIKRNGEFTVNIALVENGTPVLGVIYVPCKRLLYFGAKGMGSYRVNDIDIKSAPCDTDKIIRRGERLPIKSVRDTYIVVASRSHSNPETEAFIDEVKKIRQNVVTTSIGSSLKICLVCEGSADVYPRYAPTMEWDTAAGDGIARAMGYKLTLIDGITPLEYNKKELLNNHFIIKNDKSL